MADTVMGSKSRNICVDIYPFLLIFIVIYKLKTTLQNSIFGEMRTISFPFSFGFLLLFKSLLSFVSFLLWIAGSICVHTLILLMMMLILFLDVRCSQVVKNLITSSSSFVGPICQEWSGIILLNILSWVTDSVTSLTSLKKLLLLLLLNANRHLIFMSYCCQCYTIPENPKSWAIEKVLVCNKQEIPKLSNHTFKIIVTILALAEQKFRQ